jgi:hypothetical protein
LRVHCRNRRDVFRGQSRRNRLIGVKHRTDNSRCQIDPDVACPVKESHQRTQPLRHVFERSAPQAGSGSAREVSVDIVDVQLREVIDGVVRGVPRQEVAALPHERANRCWRESTLHLQPLPVLVA